MLHLVVAFQVAVASAGTAHVSTSRDSVAIVAQARAEAADFLWVWRFYWEASEGLRHELQGQIFPHEYVARRVPLVNRVVRDRVNHLHCHPDARGGFPLLPTIVREGTTSLRAVCPRWSLPDAPTHDER